MEKEHDQEISAAAVLRSFVSIDRNFDELLMTIEKQQQIYAYTDTHEKTSLDSYDDDNTSIISCKNLSTNPWKLITTFLREMRDQSL